MFSNFFFFLSSNCEISVSRSRGEWNIEIRERNKCWGILFLELFHKKKKKKERKRKIISIKYNCINYREELRIRDDDYYLQRVMMISRFWLKNLKWNSFRGSTEENGMDGSRERGGREGRIREREIESAIADNKRISRQGIEECSVWYEGLLRSLSQHACVKLARSARI